MTGLRYGSLFSGYGGLDLAVEQVTGAECAWQSEIDPNASTILAHHWPTVPNHGDISLIDWAAVEPVDILCGGFPCQDISSAGKQAGIKEGTRSGLWFRYADAIRVLRPRLVFVENVSALIAGGGLGVVAGSLAEIGYGCRWISLRASDVGACHRRERVFLVAWPADATGTRREGSRLPGRPAVNGVAPSLAPDLGHERAGSPRVGRVGPANGGGPDDELTLLRTPDVASARRSGPVKLTGRSRTDPQVSLHDQIAALLPTPTSSVDSGGLRVDGTPYGPSSGTTLTDVVVRLLPTPMTADAEGGRHATNLRWEGGTAYRPSGSKASVSLRESLDLLPTPTTEPSTGNGHARNLGAEVQRFGQYQAAIHRHERAFGRPVPAPKDDKGRLSPLFVEWMMGCNEGHVTGHGLTRSAELKALGNGVVTLQAATAYSLMLDELAVAS